MAICWEAIALLQAASMHPCRKGSSGEEMASCCAAAVHLSQHAAQLFRLSNVVMQGLPRWRAVQTRCWRGLTCW